MSSPDADDSSSCQESDPCNPLPGRHPRATHAARRTAEVDKRRTGPRRRRPKQPRLQPRPQSPSERGRQSDHRPKILTSVKSNRSRALPGEGPTAVSQRLSQTMGRDVHYCDLHVAPTRCRLFRALSLQRTAVSVEDLDLHSRTASGTNGTASIPASSARSGRRARARRSWRAESGARVRQGAKQVAVELSASTA